MNVKAEIDAGVCGFKTIAIVTCEDDLHVKVEANSGCENVRAMATALTAKGIIDAYQEISPAAESGVLSTARGVLKGCCAACAVPVGIFKAMQVAAGLALPKDVRITISRE